MVRFRVSVSICFALSLLLAGYLGFGSVSLKHDKLVHFFTFFILTLEFYFIFDTQNRAIKTLRYITLFVCTFAGGIFSEFIQTMVNPNRHFDVYDIYSNVSGSLWGLALGITIQSYLLKKARNQRVLQRKNLNDYNVLNGDTLSTAPKADSEDDYVNIQMKDVPKV